jgi:hypothetical protein
MCLIPNGFQNRVIALYKSLDLAPYISFCPAVLRPVRFLLMRLNEEWNVKNNSGYTRWSARSHNGCYRQHTGMPRWTQTSKTPYPHTNWKVHWCWQRNFRKCIVLGKMYQLCHLKNKYQYYKQYVRCLIQQICNCTVK